MSFWLLKTEPTCWSWQQQVQDHTATWDGVRNALAQKYMRSMKIDDLAFFYHTGKDKHIRGVVKITKEFYPDPTDETEKFHAVDVTTHQSFAHHVSLQEVKSTPQLTHLPLVKLSRLSVMPIDPNSWNLICTMGGTC